MELQLVSKKIAILAKELGFNWSCPTSKIINRNDSPARIGIPTQELLAKWLRDVHNIFLWFGQLNAPNRFHVEDIVKDDIIIGGISEGSPTYEEALEKGLFEALTLLKVIQTNSK